jgi:DNA-binding MarR family transcriptional regulator
MKKQTEQRRDPPTRPATKTRERVPGATQAFDLSWHLPHLLRRAHFDAEACFTEVYGDAATSRQLALLVALAQMPGATQVEIARAIGLDANTCSDLVRRTCAKGLMTRRRGQHDGRAYTLALTDAGQALVTDCALPLAQPYSARIAERLTPAQRQELARLLRLMLGIHVPASRSRARSPGD